MIAIPDLLIIIVVLWLLLRHPKRFVALWLAMFCVAALFIAGVLFVALSLHR